MIKLDKGYFVICRTDSNDAGLPGKYVLATSRSFETRADAEHYMTGIAPSREPVILAPVNTAL